MSTNSWELFATCSVFDHRAEALIAELNQLAQSVTVSFLTPKLFAIFLPNKNKSAAYELYSICRYFDDLADESPNDQSEKLKNEFEEICNNAEHPINRFFKKYNISIQILGDLIKGLVRDQKLVRIQRKIFILSY